MVIFNLILLNVSDWTYSFLACDVDINHGSMFVWFKWFFFFFFCTPFSLSCLCFWSWIRGIMYHSAFISSIIWLFLKFMSKCLMCWVGWYSIQLSILWAVKCLSLWELNTSSNNVNVNKDFHLGRQICSQSGVVTKYLFFIIIKQLNYLPWCICTMNKVFKKSF